jgi:hypothetical protein
VLSIMRWTVGPLPAAVYWRRRAIVLGALLFVMLLIVYACGGSKATNANSGGDPSSSLSAPPPSSSGAPVPTSPSPSLATPSVSGSELSSANPRTAPAAPSTPLGAGCTDAEIAVQTAIMSTSAATSKLQYGGTFMLKLEISNASQRTCTRDVGSVAEELIVERGGNEIWSSDGCHAPGGVMHDVRTFHPGDTIFAQVEWSSYNVTKPECRRLSTPAAVGTYQLVGRLGTKTSAPTSFEIVR